MFSAYLSNWLLLVAVFGAAVVAPGPDFVMSVRNSLLYGRRAGVFTALGFALGVLVHATYAVLGIGAIIAHSIVLFSLIKYAGAAYLIYIGIKSLRSKGASAAAIEVSLRDAGEGGRNNWQALRDGFLTNLLNPKATLFFVALFTQIVDPAMPLGVKAVFGFTCATMVGGWFALVAVIMNSASIRQTYLRMAVRIDKVFGALLVAFGVKVALSRAS